MIIGTAGHIDHGKSALVEALTGTPMDRLKEERARGITIELNFAPFDLGDGQRAGVVDVPGHEDFIRTMVAGATGTDIVLLVIAADEGIQPQTREHLAIVEQLGVVRGIPVLTKVDLVEPDWAALIRAEVAEWLAASPVQFDSPRLVSAVTGEGIDRLREDLRRVAKTIPTRSGDDLFRLPVDRSFSVAGIGTVVTGTAWSGGIAPGDQVLIMPAGKSARVRTVEIHGREAARSEPGMRVALGLAGVSKEEIRRGDSVVAAGSPWEATSALDVMVALLPDASRPLVHRTRVRLHLGTAEIMARVYPRARIEPGGTGLARLALESPVIARGGDRFVIRGFSPPAVLGGGWIVDPLPPRRRADWPPGLENSAPAPRIHALLRRRPAGAGAGQVGILGGLNRQRTEEILRDSPTLVLAGDHWVEAATVSEVAELAVAQVKAFHQDHPAEPGLPLADLRQRLRSAPWLVAAALARAEGEHGLVIRDGIARMGSFTAQVSGGDEQIDRVVAAIQRAGLTPPTTAELEQSLGVAGLGPTLRLAVRAGRIEPVERERHYARDSLDQLVSVLVELGASGLITPAQVRDRLGISRKYLIPLLEWADAKGITARVGEGRRLREGYQLPWTIPAP